MDSLRSSLNDALAEFERCKKRHEKDLSDLRKQSDFKFDDVNKKREELQNQLDQLQQDIESKNKIISEHELKATKQKEHILKQAA